MSDFPSMHADDAAKLPHVDLGELSARVPRESALVIAIHRAKPYDPTRAPETHKTPEERRKYQREYHRKRRARLVHSKNERTEK